MHVEVAALTGLDADQRAALVALVGRAGAADAHPALPEPQRLALAGLLHPPEGSRVLSARDDGELLGCAVVTPDHDGSVTLHVVLDPLGEDGPRTFSALVGRALQRDVTGSAPVHLWAMQAGETADQQAARLGFVPERDLLQMRVALPLDPEVHRKTRPLVTRPFVRGQDEEAWLRSNNRAFAGHPEQGSWTREQLEERLSAEWVDLEGFLVADDPPGGGLLGSCWTKIHRDPEGVPVLGEIYVIGVDPAHHGQGWGRSLTVAGLDWLGRQGVPVGMLYTDADNQAAVSLYRSLGFSVDHVDRSYCREAAPDEDPQLVPRPVPTARPTP